MFLAPSTYEGPSEPISTKPAAVFHAQPAKLALHKCDGCVSTAIHMYVQAWQGLNTYQGKYLPNMSIHWQ